MNQYPRMKLNPSLMALQPQAPHFSDFSDWNWLLLMFHNLDRSAKLPCTNDIGYTLCPRICGSPPSHLSLIWCYVGWEGKQIAMGRKTSHLGNWDNSFILLCLPGSAGTILPMLYEKWVGSTTIFTRWTRLVPPGHVITVCLPQRRTTWQHTLPQGPPLDTNIPFPGCCASCGKSLYPPQGSWLAIYGNHLSDEASDCFPSPSPCPFSPPWWHPHQHQLLGNWITLQNVRELRWRPPHKSRLRTKIPRQPSLHCNPKSVLGGNKIKRKEKGIEKGSRQHLRN